MARWVVLALALSCTGGVVAHTTGWSLWDGEGSRFKTQPPSQKTPLEEYEESLRKGDSLCAAGNYFDAVLAYERAWRIAYNNKLKTDAAALDARLARAKNARDQGEEGEAVRFLELTVPQATSVRVARNSDYRPPGGAGFDGVTGEDRWRVANPYLPGGHRFFSMIYGTACSTDGTLYVAANGVVPAEETRRRPRSNLDWYADNGHGVWRVDPDGRVTAFSVGPYGTYPPPGLKAQPKAVCDVAVAEAAGFGPGQWGGIVVGPTGDAYVSAKGIHMILRLRRDGTVQHVADEGNCALRRIDRSGEVTTVQKGCYADPADEGDRTKRINHTLVTIDPQERPVVGGSFVVPSVNIYSNVHRFHPDGRVEQLLSALKGYANTGGLCVEYLSGLAFLPDGRLLIADDSNNRLRTLDGKRLADWLGGASGPQETDMDGRPPQARVRRPGGLCLAGDGGVHRAGGASCRPCAQGGRQDARDDHLGLLSGRRGRTRQARRDDQQGCGVSASDLSSAGVIRVQCFAPPGMLPHSSPGAHSGW